MTGDSELGGQAILDVDDGMPLLHKPFRRTELAKQVHDVLIAA